MNPMAIRNGVLIDLDNIDPVHFTIDNVAWPLAGMERFNSHAGRWTVGKHVLGTAWLAAQIPGAAHADVYEALHHDDGEFLYTDVPAPLLTYIMQSPAYADLRQRVDAGLATAFQLGTGDPALVKRCDLLMLEAEKRAFYPDTPDWRTTALVASDPLLPFACRYVRIVQHARWEHQDCYAKIRQAHLALLLYVKLRPGDRRTPFDTLNRVIFG